ncbi:hypothetical protein GCM10027615_50450 [Plantactinospora veratri]
MITRETVWCETPASRATSVITAGRPVRDGVVTWFSSASTIPLPPSTPAGDAGRSIQVSPLTMVDGRDGTRSARLRFGSSSAIIPVPRPRRLPPPAVSAPRYRSRPAAHPIRPAAHPAVPRTLPPRTPSPPCRNRLAGPV